MEAVDLRPLLRIGGACALVFALGSLGDVVLAMTPGWGPETLPTGPAAWLIQLGERPWLGVRNLDLLNVTLAALVLPLYVGLALLLRRWERVPRARVASRRDRVVHRLQRRASDA